MLWRLLSSQQLAVLLVRSRCGARPTGSAALFCFTPALFSLRSRASELRSGPICDCLLGAGRCRWPLSWVPGTVLAGHGRQNRLHTFWKRSVVHVDAQEGPGPEGVLLAVIICVCVSPLGGHS